MGSGKSAYQFYHNFLKMTTRYQNPWSSGVMNFDSFLKNFLIVVNLEKLKIEEGLLQVRLKFKSIQDEKQALLWIPIYERKLVINQNSQVTVE